MIILIDVTKYSYSPKLLILRRFVANGETIPRWLNAVRGLSSERFGRVAYFTEIRNGDWKPTGHYVAS